MSNRPSTWPLRVVALTTHDEEALDPEQPIVDAHHHLYDRPDSRYLLDEMLADLRCGHDVRATVYAPARSMLRACGPGADETNWRNRVRQRRCWMCASGRYGNVRVCAAIVGAADLRLGDAVRPVLEAHVAAAGGAEGGRFRGVRHIAAWDPTQLVESGVPDERRHAGDAGVSRGFRPLTALGLSFDAWLLFPQIPRLTALARAFPDTPIVLNHCGGIVRIGRFKSRQDEVFADGRRRSASSPLARM